MIAGALEIQLYASMARLQSDMNQAKGMVANTMAGIERAAASAKMALGAIGAGLSLAALAGQVRQAVDQLAKLDDMAQKTGSSVENLSRLSKVAAMTGQDFGAVDAALIKLSKGMATVDSETNKVHKSLDALGIKTTDVNGRQRDSASVMIEMTKKLSEYKDGSAKTALVIDGMGKSAADLLPFMNDVNEYLHKFTGESAASAASATKLLDMLGLMRVRASELFSSFAVDLLPTLNRISDAFALSSTGAVSFGSASKAVSVVMEALVILGSEVSFVFKGMGREIGGIAAQMTALATLDFAGFKSIGKAMKEDAAAARAEHDKFIAAVMGKGVGPLNIKPKTDGQDLNYLSGNEKKAVAEKISDYQRLTQEIAKLSAEEKKRIALGRELTDGEKRQIDLMAGLASGALKMTEKEIPLAKALLATFEAQQKVRIEGEKLKKAREEIAQIVSKAGIDNVEYLANLELENSLIGKSALQQQLIRAEYQSTLTLKRQFAEIDKATKGVTDPAAIAKLQAESNARIEAIKAEARAKIKAKFDVEAKEIFAVTKDPAITQAMGQMVMPDEVARLTAIAQAEHAAALSKIADLDVIQGRLKIEEDLKAKINKAELDAQDAELARATGATILADEYAEKMAKYGADNLEFAEAALAISRDTGLQERAGFEARNKQLQERIKFFTAEADAKKNALGMSANQLTFDNVNLAYQQKIFEINQLSGDADEQKRLGLTYQLEKQGRLLGLLAHKERLDMSQVGSGKELVAINAEILKLREAMAKVDPGLADKDGLAKAAALAELKAAQILADSDAKTQAEKAKKDLDAFFDPTKAQTFGEALKGAFGTAGDAMSKLTSLLQAYGIEQAKIATAQAAAEKLIDPTERANANLRIAEREINVRVGGYGDMANAAKGFFKEESRGYKVMDGLARELHVIQMAMMLEKLYTSLFVSTGSAAGVVAGQAVETSAVVAGQAVQNAAKVPGVYMSFMSALGPWGAAAAGIAIAAVMGGAFGGGGGSIAQTSEDRQKTQGTGTVLGDSAAQSESIKNSLDEINKIDKIGLTYTRSMLDALNSIRDNIKGMVVAIASTTGLRGGAQDTKGLGLGAKPGLLGLSFLGSSSTTLLDQGIAFDRQSVNDIRNNGVSASAYSEVNTTKSGFFGIGGSSRNSTSYAALDDNVKKQMSLVVISIADGVEKAGDALGMGGKELHDRINAANAELGLISLKGLSGQALTDALDGVFSKYADTLSAEVLPGFAEFQQAGEGYYQTLVRAAVTNEYVGSTLEKLGLGTGLVGMESIRANMSLATLAGGLEKFSKLSESYTENFYSDAERTAMTWKDLNKEFERMGVATPKNRAEFRALVDGLDLTSASGRKMYVDLMEVNPVFASVTESVEDMGKAAADMAKQLADATGTIVSLLDKLRGTNAGSKVAAQIAANNTMNDLRLAAPWIKTFDQLATITAEDASNYSLANQKLIAAALEAGITLKSFADDAAAKRKQDVTDAFTGLQKSVQAERDAITKTSAASVATINTSISKLSSLAGALRQSAAGINPMGRGQAQAQIAAALLMARSMGVFPSAESLSAALQSVAQPSENLFRTFEDYKRDQILTGNDIEALGKLADNQMSVEEKTLKTLEDTQAQEMARLDAIVDKAQQQVDAMNGVNNSLLSLTDALYKFSNALANQKNPTTDFQAGMGMSNVNGILTFADTASVSAPIAASQASFDDLVAMRRASRAGLPGFAAGTNYVPQDMTARIHEGEAIIPKAYNRNNDSTNAALVTVIKELKEELKQELAKTRSEAKSQAVGIVTPLRKMAGLNEQWDATGMPPERAAL